MKSLLLALGLTTVFVAPVSARHTDGVGYPPIGSLLYNAGCEIVQEWDDAALAYCPEDGETWYFDKDGQFFYDHGIKFWITHPGWRAAPERLQIGPGAPEDAR